MQRKPAKTDIKLSPEIEEISKVVDELKKSGKAHRPSSNEVSISIDGRTDDETDNVYITPEYSAQILNAIRFIKNNGTNYYQNRSVLNECFFDNMIYFYHAKTFIELKLFILNIHDEIKDYPLALRSFRNVLKKFYKYVNSWMTLQPELYRATTYFRFFNFQSQTFKDLNNFLDSLLPLPRPSTRMNKTSFGLKFATVGFAVFAGPVNTPELPSIPRENLKSHPNFNVPTLYLPKFKDCEDKSPNDYKIRKKCTTYDDRIFYLKKMPNPEFNLTKSKFPLNEYIDKEVYYLEYHDCSWAGEYNWQFLKNNIGMEVPKSGFVLTEDYEWYSFSEGVEGIILAKDFCKPEQKDDLVITCEYDQDKIDKMEPEEIAKIFAAAVFVHDDSQHNWGFAKGKVIFIDPDNKPITLKDYLTNFAVNFHPKPGNDHTVAYDRFAFKMKLRLPVLKELAKLFEEMKTKKPVKLKPELDIDDDTYQIVVSTVLRTCNELLAKSKNNDFRKDYRTDFWTTFRSLIEPRNSTSHSPSKS